MYLSCLRQLLTGAIDYAGLFPPATLQMTEAVRSYAAYRSSDDRWALGRFVLPVQRLEEFASAWGELPEEYRGDSWSLSAVLGVETEADSRRVAEFNAGLPGRARIAAVEGRAATAADVRRLANTMPDDIERFAEVSISADLDALLDEARATGTAAKLRMGGVIPGAFPRPRM